MVLLFLALLSCVIAPPLYWLGTRNPKGMKWFQILIGFYLVYLATVHILPDTYSRVGYHALILGMSGFFMLTLAEFRWRHHRTKITQTSLVLALIGLGIHTLMDGVALGQSNSAHSHDVGVAVILHRLPMCLMFWGLLYPRVGLLKTLGVYGLISVMTIAGFASHDFGFGLLTDATFLALFEAFVAGALLHVAVEPFFARMREDSGNPHHGHKIKKTA